MSPSPLCERYSVQQMLDHYGLLGNSIHLVSIFGVDRLAVSCFIEVHNRAPCCIAGGHAVPAGNDNWPTTTSHNKHDDQLGHSVSPCSFSKSCTSVLYPSSYARATVPA